MKKIALITSLALAATAVVANESQSQTQSSTTQLPTQTQAAENFIQQLAQPQILVPQLAQPSRRKVGGAVVLDGKMPELYDIPTVGDAFKSKEQLEAPETIIVVTPTLVEEDE